MRLDVVIFGGGAAGLWLLDELVARRYRVLLLEAGHLGGGQTACAQGIIHGGLKYALDGVMSRSAAAIRRMPDVWRACLEGSGRPDLSATRVRADHCFLWRTGSVKAQLGMIGARIGLRAAPQPVAAGDRPAVLAGCPGAVVRVAEPVIDPVSFVADLAARHRGRILAADCGSLELSPESIGIGPGLEPRALVLAAGAGNAGLRRRLGLDPGRQQLRPLHMLLVRGDLPQLNGHCVEGAATRVTITSDTDGQGRTVWQVGGRLAEDGVEMDERAFLTHAAGELRVCLPGLDLAGLEWASYRIDRAEAASSGRRPADATVLADGRVLTAWPTKLALAPHLAERVIDRLDPPAGLDEPGGFEHWPRPEVARPPWETCTTWCRDL